MALVNNEQETMLATLQSKFNDYIENSQLISIHINAPHMEIHQSICPDIAVVNSNELNLSFGHFDFLVYFIDVVSFDIKLETEESFCIVADDIEIYVDFAVI